PARRGRGRVAPSLGGAGAPPDHATEPVLGGASGNHDQERSAIAHLGPYAPLIATIREELEQFAESQLRLHITIAERDRYVLTSIDIDCEEHGEHAALL